MNREQVRNLLEAVHRGDLATAEALEKLSELDPRRARVVELRFFGGMTIEQTAAVLDVSKDRVKADWRFARAWLKRELAGEP